MENNKSNNEKDFKTNDKSHYLVIFIMIIIVIIIIYYGVVAPSIIGGGILISKKDKTSILQQVVPIFGSKQKKSVRFNLRKTKRQIFKINDPPSKIRENSHNYWRSYYG